MTPVSQSVDLATFDNGAYHPGRSVIVQAAWFFLGLPLLRSALIPFSGFRARLLRAFGARLGEGCVFKPGFRIKYPWHLEAGRNCWFGEDAWIDNLVPVIVGDNVCISQGAYFCTGNHDWSDPSFGLVTGSIRVGSGAWIGARATLAPGVVIGECAIVSMGAVVSKGVPPFEIHAGNPAKFVRFRAIKPPVAASHANPEPPVIVSSAIR